MCDVDCTWQQPGHEQNHQLPTEIGSFRCKQADNINLIATVIPLMGLARVAGFSRKRTTARSICRHRSCQTRSNGSHSIVRCTWLKTPS
jgi:hypothetical protein